MRREHLSHPVVLLNSTTILSLTCFSSGKMRKMTHTHGFFSDEIINPWTGGKFNLSEEAEDNAAQDGKFFSVWGYSWPNLCLLSLSHSIFSSVL